MVVVDSDDVAGLEVVVVVVDSAPLVLDAGGGSSGLLHAPSRAAQAKTQMYFFIVLELRTQY